MGLICLVCPCPSLNISVSFHIHDVLLRGLGPSLGLAAWRRSLPAPAPAPTRGCLAAFPEGPAFVGGSLWGCRQQKAPHFRQVHVPRSPPPVHPAGCCQHGLPSVHVVCSSLPPLPPIQPRACTLVGSLRRLEGSGFTPWGLSPQPAEMWDLRFSQTRGPRPDTRWLDRQVTSQREAGGCPVSPRGTWLCLTSVRPMARLTSGAILPVRPGPPSPSPGRWEEAGEQLTRAASQTGASGPPPGGQINPLPFRAEDTQWDEVCPESDQENRSIIIQTGACPTPHPPVAPMRLACGRALLCLAAAAWSLHFQACPRAGRVRPSLAGLRRAGRCLGGFPVGAQQMPSRPSAGGGVHPPGPAGQNAPDSL